METAVDPHSSLSRPEVGLLVQERAHLPLHYLYSSKMDRSMIYTTLSTIIALLIVGLCRLYPPFRSVFCH